MQPLTESDLETLPEGSIILTDRGGTMIRHSDGWYSTKPGSVIPFSPADVISLYSLPSLIHEGNGPRVRPGDRITLENWKVIPLGSLLRRGGTQERALMCVVSETQPYANGLPAAPQSLVRMGIRGRDSELTAQTAASQRWVIEYVPE